MIVTTHDLWVQFLAVVLPALGTLLVAVCSVGALAVYNWARTKGLQEQVNTTTALAAHVTTPAVVAASVACPHCQAQVPLDALAPQQGKSNG
jgi:hypothetical protein